MVRPTVKWLRARTDWQTCKIVLQTIIERCDEMLMFLKPLQRLFLNEVQQATSERKEEREKMWYSLNNSYNIVNYSAVEDALRHLDNWLQCKILSAFSIQLRGGKKRFHIDVWDFKI